MVPYTDNQGRTWELTPIPLHDQMVGGQVIGWLCWVKLTVPGAHPYGDYARAGYNWNSPPVVRPTNAQALDAGRAFADGYP